ncbi:MULTISPECIES: calcium/sodium antiporter [Pseudomonas]|uniref:Calcium/sodium antiporter n=1 Tax=Pseudomonas qingdaonensis TaxID=2056231 RepID=A0ABX8DZ57_9PSED|nr:MULTISPECIES: calcium/sodium antiporter [Pseudomonas]KIU49700.1 conjugal transfer protein TraR [Pseudomonas putida]MBG8562204.1 calcium/sodium antiporter [Pseudomonas qingdaonensis]MCP8351043.1 conjugal transfer protein TraR [Pseudomonas sp. FBF18]MDD1954693.1 calcium/sodium antiporter [Pseudomonas sp. 8209]MEC6742015.1 calcium/sodium antiporter [Pseudomonas qingdaonensis]
MALGLLLLITGAELLVRAALRLAASLQVRPLIIGLSLVAFGSSAPQLTVSLQAAYTGAPDVAVGSVIGSNIFNVLVTLGLAALIIPLRVSRQLVRLDIPLMIGASLLVYLLALDERIGRLEGALLLLGLVAYLAILWHQSRHHARTYPAPGPRPQRGVGFWFGTLALMLTGLGLLSLAGHLLLEAAVEVAVDLGLSERVIGLTVVAVCTSLPELATSLIAALRGEREIAVGNVIGSNLFNLLAVLGLTALVAPVPLSISPNALAFDLPVMLGVAVLTLPVFYSGYRVTRAEGLVFLCLYLAYGLHVVAFTTGMPLANRLEQLMLLYVLPTLAVVLMYTTVRAWRRQH